TKTDVIIQSAINSCQSANSGHVWIPDGTYVVTHGIGSIGISHITVEGESRDGTILDSSATALLTGTGGVAYSTAVPSTTPTLDPSSQWGTLFFDVDPSLTISDIVVKNLTIKSSIVAPAGPSHLQHTVYFGESNNVRMENCHIYCGYYEAVYLISQGYYPYDTTITYNMAFVHNIFEGGHDIQLNPNSSTMANFLADGNTFLNGAFAINAACAGGRIVNNYIYNMTLGGITIDSISNPTLIANNYVDGIGIHGVGNQPFGIGALAGPGTDGVLVIGNTVRRVYSNGTAYMASGNVTLSNNKASLAMENLDSGLGYAGIYPGPAGIVVLDWPTVSNVYLNNNIVEPSTLIVAVVSDNGGPTSPNGDYDNVTPSGAVGTLNGKPLYGNGSYYIWYDGSANWAISPVINRNPALGYNGWYVASSASTPPTGPYTAAGTVTGTCSIAMTSPKWQAGIACGGTANSGNTTVHIQGGAYNDIISGGYSIQNLTSVGSANVSVINAELPGGISGPVTRVQNCLGYPTAPAVPATTVEQQNTTGQPCRVTITGGTVTKIAKGYTSGALITTNITSGVVELGAGEIIAVTYSALPTWVWMGI